MGSSHIHSSIDQKIFKSGLSVEAISLYLLFCGLADEGRSITTRNIMGIWNGGEDSANAALSELEKRNIIQKTLSDDAENCVYSLVAGENWEL
jgi:hypothetical protein